MNETLTSIIVNDLTKLIDKKVDKTQTINNKLLNQNIFLTKTDIGLSNVNNTSDLDKPVSLLQQEALDLKVDKTIKINNYNLYNDINIRNTDIIGIENINNTSDLDKPVSLLQQEALDLKVDKTIKINNYQLNENITLIPSDIGLDQVDNTSDLNKPISNAVQSIIDNIINLLNINNLSVQNINTNLGLYVEKTIKINNYPLNENITLTQSDIGLDQVNNTSDINKPISNLQQELFNLKEDITNKNISNGYAGLDNSSLILKSQIPSSIFLPVGSIICFSSSNIPHSYLFCDGSEVPINEYPLLYSIIGTQYNKPNINTSLFFNLPDLRSYFIRCIDTSRTIGSIESWSTGMPINNFITNIEGDHSHTTNAQGDHSHTTNIQGDHQHTTDVQGNHTHWVSSAPRDDGNGGGCMTFEQMYGLWADSGGYTDYDPGYPYGRNIGYSGNHSHTTNVTGNHSHTTNLTGNHSHTTNITGNHSHTISGGDLETRPKNIALYYIIKALI
jgi:microcystin-dependent protein